MGKMTDRTATTVRNEWKRLMDGKSGRVAGSAVRLPLQLLSFPYGLAAGTKNYLYNHHYYTPTRLPARVISIGNLSVGGTGKTPLTLMLARYYKTLGVPAAILSRGYKGDMERGFAVVSDGNEVFHGPEQVGDEPYLMAVSSGVPVLVGRNRSMTGAVAVSRFGARVLLLDDGFQHRRVARDVDIVLVDGRNRLCREQLLPAGPLRESVGALRRAHAVVLTRYRDSETGRENIRYLGRRFPGLPLFFADHRPDSVIVNGKEEPSSLLQGRRVVAFSGLAANTTFLRTVEGLGGSVVRFVEFDDHHRYSREDADGLVSAARKEDAEVLITTEKDGVKLAGLLNESFNPWIVRIRFSLLQDEEAFLTLVNHGSL